MFCEYIKISKTGWQCKFDNVIEVEVSENKIFEYTKNERIGEILRIFLIIRVFV
jgi:hypothetical protein